MTHIFGSKEPHVQYAERRAAYVVIADGEKVATVNPRREYFLPGGGSLSGETPEETIAREVREELARGVRRLQTNNITRCMLCSSPANLRAR